MDCPETTAAQWRETPGYSSARYNRGLSGAMFMRGFLLCLLALSVAAYASDPESVTVIGVNKDLSDGARALQMGDFEEGLRLTIAGLRFESSARNRAGGLSNLCAGYTAVKQYAEAIDSCNEALKIDDQNWHAYNNRALAYLGQGEIDAAKRDLQDGLRLNADSRKLFQVAEMIEARERPPPLAIDE
jgi:tetratricopeptide (TPR) repeat protein